MQSVAIHECYSQSFYNDKNYKSQQSSSIYNPSHHKTWVPKDLGGRDICRTCKAENGAVKEQVAQWATIAHLRASIMFGDTIIYDALRQITLNLKR